MKKRNTLNWKEKLEEIRFKNPSMYQKLLRYIKGYMHRKGIVSLEKIQSEANISYARHEFTVDPNMPSPRADTGQLEKLNRKIIYYAEKYLKEDEVESVIHSAFKNEAAINLGATADNPGVSFEHTVEKLQKFKRKYHGEKALDTADALGARVSLIRRFLTDQLEFINIAKHYLSIEEIASIVDRIIVPGKGSGKVGGKAAGLILAQNILKRAYLEERLSLEPKVPSAYYIRSDAILHFIEFNNLQELTNIKYREISEIIEEYPMIEQVFKNAKFPGNILKGLEHLLKKYNRKPLIIRSSSLLEDRAGTAFSGKYKSLFVANQGTINKRLDELTNAIAEVYASTFSPDAITYRREKGLLDFQEEMGIIIQEVVGDFIGDYYFPCFAGVAFSKNEFRWSPRIKRDDGMARMVMGLGTRAVDRTYDDYAFLFCPAKPGLRANTQPDEIIRYSQRYIDVINLKKGHFETLPVDEFFSQVMDDIDGLENLVSIYKGGNLIQPSGLILNEKANSLFITFERLLKIGVLPKWLRDILSILEKAYGCAVDIEFAADTNNFYLLQCRPQSRSSQIPKVTFPKKTEREHILFTSTKYVQNGYIPDITHVVIVDPIDYDKINNYDTFIEIGKAVGTLNRLLPRRKFILMGPGRWGSRGDIKLGLRVNYSDINNCAMLIEIARRKGGYVPEVSFGTHFFQDLIEANIRYLPLYPDEEESFLNEDLIKMMPNILSEILPSFSKLATILKVFDIPAVHSGKVLHVLMDSDEQKALAYIDYPK